MGRDALDRQRRVLGPEHRDTQANAMYNLVLPLSNLGRNEEALALSRETVAAQSRVLGVSHPKTLRSMYNLACMAEIHGDRSQSLGALREAVAHGFANLALLEGDADLRALRTDPGYGEILAGTRRNQERESR